ncbi:hypothetical protein DICPUDRAFT_47540 [Dictyostelium purpureum]|uniref:GHMP kinase N-terminal domain-containing protein n=1 Tax=Dictyostelium purpureum TaxID=5786 RepID=F0ZJZ7_DICPU|nr:uncharacterized protein DICPUDRAFT_47540 [Dictyostelium purpureum]EGC35733.1 hypothetical protein DICPUDRAFT_47540 [Dictyostelium purpureum]|eukprot:XP_003287736.1 hypothetical protein DICPUDRAFT_47540 [Dictyostelium purpureum]
MIKNEDNSIDNSLYRSLDLNEIDTKLYNFSIGIVTATNQKQQNNNKNNLQISNRNYGINKLNLEINFEKLDIHSSNDATCLNIDNNSILNNSNSYDYVLEESNQNHQITKTILKSLNFLNNNYPTIYNQFKQHQQQSLNINFNENHGYLSSFTYFNNNDDNNNNNNFNSYHLNYNDLTFNNISNYGLIKLFIDKSRENGTSSQVIEYQLSLLYSVAIIYWLIISQTIQQQSSDILSKSLLYRISLHRIQNYILSLSEQDYCCLLKAFEVSNGLLDSDHLFLDYINDIKSINQQQLSCFEKLKVSPSIDTIALELYFSEHSNTIDSELMNETIENVIKKRDTKVSWYMGSVRLDSCYERDQLKKALSIDDVTERRYATYQVIKRFDPLIEEFNSIRLSNQFREDASIEHQPKSFKKNIVVGRESRAFSNQATLFASSTMVEIDRVTREIIKDIATSLDKQYFNSLFEKQFSQMKNNKLNSFRLKLLEPIKHLLASIGRFSSLSSKRVQSITQIHGAIIQLKETLTIVHGKCYQMIDEFNTRSTNLHAEGSTRTLNLSQSNNFIQLYRFIDNLYARGYGIVWGHLYRLEEHVLGSRKEYSTYSVLLQRPSMSGSERFRTNDLEPKPEQEESLQKLIRIGGENIHMSPSNCWVEHCTDLIEAVPLFIYERTHVIDGKSTTVFEVDQEGLELTIRSLADPWSKNIKITMDTEHLALAREFLVLSDQELSSNAQSLLDQYPNLEKEFIYRNLLINQKDQIIKLALHLENEFNSNINKIEQNIELNWKNSKFITRLESFKEFLLNQSISLEKKSKSINLSSINQNKLSEFKYYSLKKQRNLPAFHLLTTEAPGLVEGFIQAVLEEEMCLKNIVEHHHLEAQVKEKQNQFRNELLTIGKKVIEEFNYQPIVEQRMNQLKISNTSAILSIISDNIIIQKQVSLLAVLYQLDQIDTLLKNNTFSLEEAIKHEPKGVIKILENNLNYNEFEKKGIEFIYHQNKTDKELSLFSSSMDEVGNVIKTTQPYKNELQAFIHWEARLKLLDNLDKERPELFLSNRLNKFHRNHTSLSLTTARRSVVSENSLLDQMNNPMFSYSCGAIISKDASIRPSGMRKRYHFVYGPSRVNLGKDERKSVETWPQFVGVTDPLCAKHAFDFYSLINHNPIIRTITAAENLKVSENQNTALTRSIRNVQALFVERLGVGDIEDLAYQFNQRGGLAVALHKESEGFSGANPTAGYCIPKDLLFKLFVVTHQDSRKLSMIGIPCHLHTMIIQMMIEISSRQWQFQTNGEWENWAAKQFTEGTNNSLLKKFCGQFSDDVSKYMEKYIQVTGGIVVLHVSKLCQILGKTGIPSPLVNWQKDLHSALWSFWAEKKITLGGEQVNRSLVFPLTLSIPDSGNQAIALNPNCKGLPSEDKLRVHMFGVYKGDDDQKPPPDVRFAWVMRAFMILSGHYKEVALSLDEEGQLIARLSWLGFNPTSNHPEDIEARRYLAQQFLNCNDFDQSNKEHKEMISKLKERFPPHSTVGDITVTTVPGVDSEDLLGFSAETLHLLGDDATEALEYLKSKGISIDQLKANAQLHRQFIDEWIPLCNLPENERDEIKREIGGKIHPLVLRLRGPGNDFFKDLQGQDVVVFSITHPQLLELNPATLRDLMIIGRPNSSLCALDFVSQGRHRCWFERDVMLWYASCLSIDSNGVYMTGTDTWRNRKVNGRKSIYRSFGWGKDQYQPFLGTDLREEVYRQEDRAIMCFEYLENIYNSTDDKETLELIDKFNFVMYGKNFIVPTLVENKSNSLFGNLENEIELLIQYEQRVLLANRSRKRDFIISKSLQQLIDKPNVSTISPIHWLSIGGYLLLNGATSKFQTRVLTMIQNSYQKINNLIKFFNESNAKEVEYDLSVSSLFDQQSQIKELIIQQLAPSKIQLKDRKGKMFSVKASEEHVETGVTRRKELLLQSKKNQMMKSKTNGFNSLKNSISHSSLTSIKTMLLIPIHENIKKLNYYLLNIGNSNNNLNSSSSSISLQSTSIENSFEKINYLIGQIYQLSTNVLESLVHLILMNNSNTINEKQTLLKLISELCINGNEIDIKVWDQLVGTYESFGKITPLYQESHNNLSYDDHIEVISIISEVLSTLLLFEKTGTYLSLESNEYNDQVVWRSLAEFFAKTIDDHYSEYTPWTLDPKRYSLFQVNFDEVGVMLEGKREEQFKIYWSSHRNLYEYIRLLIINKTSLINQVTINNLTIQLSDLSASTNSGISNTSNTSSASSNIYSCIDLLLGKTFICPTDQTEQDNVIIRAIGALAPNHYELLWRSYNQLREIVFIKNDGFQPPRVFAIPIDPYLEETLDASNKVNHCYLSPVGRTHYASSLMEGPTLKDNLFITRDGHFIEEESSKQRVLTINDAFYWINETQYRFYLKNYLLMSDQSIEIRVKNDYQSKVLLPTKGVLIASRFVHPIAIGSVITLHHHRLEPTISNSGYPTTDKSPFLYEMTYNKSLYPLIFNEKSKVLLPPEIDWLQIETVEHFKQNPNQYQELMKKIEARLLPFVHQYPIIIVKGAAESGARNLSRFDLLENQDSGTGEISKKVLQDACDFILNISKSQNVVIQRAIISSPLFWMSHNSVKKMVERQINDYGVALELNRHPKDSIYGTLRIILSSSTAKSNSQQDLDNIENWKASHPITLNSLQIATNVGRQGQLELLTKEMIKPQLSDSFIKGLEDAGKLVMSAMSSFGPTYWNKPIELYDQSFKSYHERFPSVNEFDALGTPIWWPRYLMLDFIPEPVWVKKGTDQIIDYYRIIDISIPPTTENVSDSLIDNSICPVTYLLKDLKTGEEFEGEVKGMKFWHLEPNVGIGLWTNVAKRQIELYKNKQTQQIDWSNVGDNDRIVISNMLNVGRKFVSTLSKSLLAQIKSTILNFDDKQYQHSDLSNSLSSGYNIGTQSQSGSNKRPSITIINDQQHKDQNSQISKDLIDNIKSSSTLNHLKDNPEEFINNGIKLCKNYLKNNLDKYHIEIDNYLYSIVNDDNSMDDKLNLYLKRIVERYFDSVISQDLTPYVEIISPDREEMKMGDGSIWIEPYIKHPNTFAVITGKATLMNHHFYPFFQSFQLKINSLYSEDSFPLNVIGINKDWIKYNSDEGYAYVTRCQVLSRERCPTILEFNVPSNISLKLSSCFILELDNTELGEETNLHQSISDELKKHNVFIMNDYSKSLERCDDKYWLKSNIPKWFQNGEIKTNQSIACIHLGEILTERDITKKVEKQAPELDLLDLNLVSHSQVERGVILQPKSNTTESEGVEYFAPPNAIKKAVQNLMQKLDSNDSSSSEEYIISPFIDSVKTKSDNRRIIVRINACIGGLTTISIVKAGSPEELIISPGVRGSKWVMVSEVLNDLPISIKKKDWISWANIAHSILSEIELPIVGIDMILCHDTIKQCYTPYILEANSRPGSLIMAEQLFFKDGDDMNAEFESCHMSTPISTYFWCMVLRNCHLSIESMKKILSPIILKERYCKFDSKNPSSRSIKNDELELLNDRQTTITELLDNAVNQHQFNSKLRSVLIGSNGRDRVFMGHSDFLGLGGFTVDSNTINEILCVAQISSENINHHPAGTITLSNENENFQVSQFSIDDDVLKPFNRHHSARSQEPLWDPISWENYIKSLLAYLFLKRDEFPKQVVNDLTSLKSKGLSLSLHFSNKGMLGLGYTGGVSSSSALTGAVILALNYLFDWNLTKEQMASTDYAEYFMGKSGGASDKTAQLFSKKGKISIIGSIPERFIKSIKFPDEILVIMAESSIPRLTSLAGRRWIADNIENKFIKNNSVDMIFHWANQIMKSFGSMVCVDSIEILKDKLSNPNEIEKTSQLTDLTDIELKKLYLSISKNNLLRDLSADGEIENQFPELKNNRLKRYQYIYKLLLLLPEHKRGKNDQEFWNRKSILYVLSELERGIVYQQIICFLNQNNNKKQKKQLVKDLMTIVKTAHDGDKQLLDYRDGFKETKWVDNFNNNIDNVTINNWIKEIDKYLLPSSLKTNTSLSGSSSIPTMKSSLSFSKEFGIDDKFNLFYFLNNPNTHSIELSLKMGGFQRSLPDFDDLADELYSTFKEKAALRVAAAGLGGNVCIHVYYKKINSVIDWISKRNFNVRKIDFPGPPTQSIFQ